MRRLLAFLFALGCVGDAAVKTEPWPYPPLEPPPGLSPTMGNAEDPVVLTSCEIAPLTPTPVGQPVTFRAAKGPDPKNFTYTWELEDGVRLTGPTVTHTFKSPQRYIVTLDVESKTSEDDTTACRSMQIVHRPLPERRPSHCSPIVFDNSKPKKVWVVNPDADTVAALDPVALAKLGEYPVGANPRAVAPAPDGAIWVLNQDSFDIHVLDAGTGAPLTKIPLPHASQPFCLAFSPDGRRGYVTLQALGRVVEIDPAARKLTGKTLDLPAPDGVVPRVRGLAIAPDSRRALVTRFVSPDGRGEVYDVRIPEDDGPLTATIIPLGIATPEDSRVEAPGFPNFLSHIVINSDGSEAWVPSKQDNMERGTAKDEKGNFVRGGQPLTFETLMRPIVSVIDLGKRADSVKRRVDNDQANMPYNAVTSPFGDLVFVAVQGNNQVDVVNSYGSDIISVLVTSHAPQGLAMLDGKIWIQNYLHRSVTVYDVSTILRGDDTVGVHLKTFSTVEKEPLPPAELRGKQIFFNSVDPRMSSHRYMSCAACHLDGGHDGRVWDFTDRGEGLRNTKTLLGVGLPEQGRLHWSANFDEFQDFENDVRRHAFGGSGFLTDEAFERTKHPLGPPKAGLNADLDALAAFMRSLTTIPKSPYRNPDGTLTAAGERGKAAFEKARCGACHIPTRGFTDSKLDDSSPLHDVGTLKATSGRRLDGPLPGLDTPSLRGAWASAPYLHDGSARTLREVLNRKSPALTSGLTDAEKDDLAEYVRQIE